MVEYRYKYLIQYNLYELYPSFIAVDPPHFQLTLFEEAQRCSVMTSSTARRPSPVPDDPVRTATKLQLDVVGGLHRGVALAPDPGTYRIGSSPQADIVLRDHGVAPEHAILRLDRTAVRIDAIGGDIGLNHHLIPAAHGCRARMPLDIALGEARLHLSDP